MTYDPAKWGGMPAFAGVYVIYFGAQPVYVGQSVNIASRFAMHKIRHSYGPFVITPWGDVPRDQLVRVKVRRSARVGDWAMWEIRLIQRLNPIHNRQFRKKVAV